MSTPLLSLKGINKSFGPVHVLKDVDFDVYPGQVTALVGDNGAGKSTLIKCIAGIYTPESGEFVFEGKSVTIDGPRAATALGIEIVYQDLALWVLKLCIKISLCVTTSTLFTICSLVARRRRELLLTKLPWSHLLARLWTVSMCEQ